MKTSKFLLPVLLLFFCFSPIHAQETPAEKYDNVEFYTISFFKWEDGKREDAMKMINEYFKPSAQDVGQQLPLMEVDLLYSDWDHMVVFPMEEGLQVFEWKTSPGEAKWLTALQERVGTKEKMEEMWKNFASYVEDSKSMLARKAN